MNKLPTRIALTIGAFTIVMLILNFQWFIANVQQVWWENTAESRVISKEPAPQIAQNTLSIPSLNIMAPIIYVDRASASEQVFQEALVNGVVHFPGTALPGQVGNTYIFGHSSDFPFSKGNYKTVFALLPQIAQGAEIKLTNGSGEEFTYIVTGIKVVSPKDLQYLESDNSGRKMLTVQTSYPIGTALRRFLVFAELK
jgi:LPXTG-site transpeptidase (sortase) family protein